jgi:hypothetical protein
MNEQTPMAAKEEARDQLAVTPNHIHYYSFQLLVILAHHGHHSIVSRDDTYPEQIDGIFY